MTEKTIYVADDGTEFETKEDCFSYEKTNSESNKDRRFIYFLGGYEQVKEIVEGEQPTLNWNNEPLLNLNQKAYADKFKECCIIYVENQIGLDYLASLGFWGIPTKIGFSIYHGIGWVHYDKYINVLKVKRESLDKEILNWNHIIGNEAVLHLNKLNSMPE